MCIKFRLEDRGSRRDVKTRKRRSSRVSTRERLKSKLCDARPDESARGQTRSKNRHVWRGISNEAYKKTCRYEVRRRIRSDGQSRLSRGKHKRLGCTLAGGDGLKPGVTTPTRRGIRTGMNAWEPEWMKPRDVGWVDIARGAR